MSLVDLDLIRKYNVPAPRYTSYPPATHFKDLSEAMLLEKINEGKASPRDISLYFHLPFCQSLCWYCGCTTVITKQQDSSKKYIDYLNHEMDLMQPHLNPANKVVQMHFGGGTPTFLQPDEIRQLGKMIRSHFTYADDIEASVEIDPRRIVRDHIVALAESGFNRASIGVQDFDPQVQLAVHRVQSKEETEKTVQWLRELGFVSINIDLIYGLPHQTLSSFEKTVNDVLKFKPDRFAVFSYAHVPWLKPAQNILKALPSPELKLELFRLTVDMLTSNGYVYIGMDHFARKDDDLTIAQKNKTLQRNFQGYSTHGNADIYAFGMSSISQANGLYWQNKKELPDYYAAVDAKRVPVERGYILTEDDKIRRQVIMRLMCDMSLNYRALSEKIGIDFTRYFESELESLNDLVSDGLIEKHAEGLVVTDLGRLLIRNIAVHFDAYHAQRKELHFSKTI